MRQPRRTRRFRGSPLAVGPQKREFLRQGNEALLSVPRAVRAGRARPYTGRRADNSACPGSSHGWGGRSVGSPREDSDRSRHEPPPLTEALPTRATLAI